MSRSSLSLTLSGAANRWSLTVADWRSKMIQLQDSTNVFQTNANTNKLKSEWSKEQLIEELKFQQQQAEERVRRMKEELESGSIDEDEEVSDESDAEENGDQKHDPQSNKEDDGDHGDDDDDDDEDDENEYDTELEYFVHEILCLDAINHELPCQEKGDT